MKKSYRKNSFQARIASLLSDVSPDTRFNVIVFDLWHDGEGWSVNSGWTPGWGREISLEEIPDAAYGRWLVFKANYFPRAQVKDLEWNEGLNSVTCQGISVFELRKNSARPSRTIAL